ncbi:MAG: hypothetical protein RLZZ188_2681, partial [Verrucomicrobiota bacterium]
MAYRARKKAASVELSGGVMRAVPELTPGWLEPAWASELCDLWERAVAGERVRCVVTVPVRFG